MRPIVDYGPDLEEAIQALTESITDSETRARFPDRWLAVALLDRDPGLEERIVALEDGPGLLTRRDAWLDELESRGIDAMMSIAGHRFDAAHDIATDASRQGMSGPSLTDRIDRVVTDRWLGIPIFLFLMWAVFKLTTDVAGAFLDRVDDVISGPVSSLAGSGVAAIGLGGTWIESLIIDGAIAGLGAILVFVPVLVCLYVALAFLEDTGYMARAAFVMDRVMGGVGLQGKSFLPMLVGFGCTVPAVSATRTLDSQRDRILTTLLVPFMSCGARLPVYVLLGTVFFPSHAGLVVFAMYLVGIVVALVLGLILRRTLLPVTHHTPTIMELPPYRMPTLGSIWFHTWGRTRAFLRDAGSIIFVTMLVVWLLMAIPITGEGRFGETRVEDSAFASVSSVVAPVFEPAGFGTWEATGSLLSGFVAKEVVIGTMAQTYGIVESDTPEVAGSVASRVSDIGTGLATATIDAVRAIPAIVGIHLGDPVETDHTSGSKGAVETGFDESSDGNGAMAALAFMVFVLLYTPCVAAAGAIRREIGARWMWASIIGQTLLAWVMAVAVFQLGARWFS